MRFLLGLLCITATICATSGNSLKKVIYNDIPNVNFCTLKLNKTSTVGCRTGKSGNVGAIKYFKTSAELDKYLNSKIDHHVILLITSPLFVDSGLMSKAKSKKLVNGIIVIDCESPSSCNINTFSEDAKVPNSKYYVGKISDSINKAGVDYATIMWPFPVALIQASEGNKLIECYNMHNVNASGRLCAAQLTTHMSAVGNAALCDKRNALMGQSIIRLKPVVFCDAVVSYSPLIWVSKEDTIPVKGKVTLIMTRVDIRSMFTTRQYGVSQLYPSVAVLMGVALNAHKFRMNVTTNYIFGFMDGESMDYLGSMMLAYKLKKGFQLHALNVTFANITSIIELGSLASLLNGNKTIYVKGPKAIYDKIKSSYSDAVSSTSTNFLPGSVQTFLLHGVSNGILSHISDSDTEINSPFYNAFLDKNITNMDKDFSKTISDLVNAIGGAIGIKNDNGGAHFANEIYNCFLDGSQCALFKEIFEGDLYDIVTKKGFVETNELGKIAAVILNYKTATFFNRSLSRVECRALYDKEKDNATYTYDIIVVNGSSKCIKSPIQILEYTTDNLNPEKRINPDHYYPVWRQSASTGLNLRIFLLPSRFWEIICIVTGCFFSISSLGLYIVVIYFGPPYLKEIFE